MAIATGVSPEEHLQTEYKPDCDYVDGVLVAAEWIIDPCDREAFMVTQQTRVPQQVDQLRWNDVVVQLSEILSE